MRGCHLLAWLTVIACTQCYPQQTEFPFLKGHSIPEPPKPGALSILAAPPAPFGVDKVLASHNFLLGFAAGLIYKSPDLGASWEVFSIDPIQVRADNPSTFLAVNRSNYSFFGKRLFRSINEGVVWTKVDLPEPMPASVLLAENIVYCLAENRIHWSTDQGATWSHSTSPVNVNNVSVHVFTGNDAGTIAIVVDPGASNSLPRPIDFYISRDSGQHWSNSLYMQTQLTGLILDFALRGDQSYIHTTDGLFAVSADRPSRKLSDFGSDPKSQYHDFATFGNRFFILKNETLLASDDGTSWSNVLPNETVRMIVRDPTAIIAIAKKANATALFRLSGNLSWAEVSEFHEEVPSFAFSTNGHLILRGAKGAYLQTDNGWKAIKRIMPLDAVKFYGHGEDLFTTVGRRLLHADRDGNWEETAVPPPMLRDISDLSLSDQSLLMSSGGQLFLSRDLGHSWHEIILNSLAPEANARRQAFQSIFIDRNSLYAAFLSTRTDQQYSDRNRTVVVRSLDSGDSWEQIGEFPFIGGVKLAVDYAGRVYLSSDTRGLLKRDSGGTWINISGELFVGRYGRLRSVWIGSDGLLAVSTYERVYWSADLGASWHPFLQNDSREIESGPTVLADIDGRSVLISSAKGLYLGLLRNAKESIAGFTSDLTARFDGLIPNRRFTLTIDGKVPTPSEVLVQSESSSLKVRSSPSWASRLEEGAHSIRLSQGNLQQMFYAWKDITAGWLGFTPYGKSYAVVAAISYSGSKGFPELPSAEPQARKLAKLLTSQGFELKEFYGPDATKDAIESYLFRNLKGKLTKNDRLLVYFGGHGATVDGAQGKSMGYLVTSGVTSDAVELGLPMSRIEGEYASIIKANHVLFVLDACFSGLAATRSPDPRSLSFQAYSQIKMFTEQPMRAVLTAGRKQDEALDDNGGIFTSAFMDGINGAADSDHNGVVTLTELYLYVQQRVSRVSMEALGRKPQIPQLSQMSSYGEGQFLFFYR